MVRRQRTGFCPSRSVNSCAPPPPFQAPAPFSGALTYENKNNSGPAVFWTAETTVVSDNYDAGVKCALDMMQRFEKARIVLLEHQNVLSAVDRINGFLDTVSTIW